MCSIFLSLVLVMRLGRYHQNLSEIKFVFSELRHKEMPLPRETSFVLFSEYFNLEKFAPNLRNGPGRNGVSGGEGEN